MSSDSHKKVWNKEYKTGSHLALSTNPSEDLEKFRRWLERTEGRKTMNVTSLIIDVGCGNGRNLGYMTDGYGCRGIGYDISDEAIRLAKTRKSNTSGEVLYVVQPLNKDIPAKDNTASLVLDMMASHVLNKAEREHLRDEVLRVLRRGGWLFFKTFLSEGDIHTRRLLRDNAGKEEGSYIHPEFGVEEHVWDVPEVEAFFGEYFTIHKIEKSHRHIINGRAGKRRTMSVYMQKI